MATTTNYNLPLFDGNRPADLVNTFNPAMNTIDSTLKSVSDAASAGGGFSPGAGDKVLTATNLAALKVTASGIVYLPQE